MTEWDEQACIQAAKKDPSAFGEIYEHYVERIYSYVYHRVGNVHDAEDLTSRVFYRALAHLDSYDDRGVPFSAWLYRIAHNLVANFHRDRTRRPVLALDELANKSLAKERPEALAEQEDDERLLQEVIRELDQVRQELLVLKFTEGLSNAEIGEIMGRSEGAIKSLYHRTLLQMRKEMEKKGIKFE
ncbi:MAG: sigma-70 family RNA polymerase sigma factor [Chloroflexi bacterium]|nr:sigma-70 family RNA polymerase sigma factor [Chloroflexota bacterium]